MLTWDRDGEELDYELDDDEEELLDAWRRKLDQITARLELLNGKLDQIGEELSRLTDPPR